MIRLSLQIFLAIACAFPLLAQTRVPNISFDDIDGRSHSLNAGKVTLVIVINRGQQAQADAVGARMPDKYLGDPHYQIITVVKFAKRPGYLFRKFASAVIRHRLDVLADRLRRRYSAKKIAHDPRVDLFVVADFDAKISAALQVPRGSNAIAVFLFDAHGALLKRWSKVPSIHDLTAHLSRASHL